jgi:hypothetical protein
MIEFTFPTRDHAEKFTRYQDQKHGVSHQWSIKKTGGNRWVAARPPRGD